MENFFCDNVFVTPIFVIFCVSKQGLNFFLFLFVTLVGNFFCGFLTVMKIRSHAALCTLDDEGGGDAGQMGKFSGGFEEECLI